MMTSMSVEFLLTALIVVLIPGAGALYTMAAGMTRGVRASLVAAVGCTLGIVPHLLAAITGLAAVLYASSVAFGVLRWLGVAYLLVMAVGMLRGSDGLDVSTSDSAPRSAWRVIVRGVLVNVLNPKLSIFFFAFLPQFVSPSEPHAVLHMTGLSLVFMAMTLAVFAGYGVFAASIRRHVIGRPRVLTWLRRTFAGAFVALGARLAFADR